ncbi:MAG: efflux RND transporter periplasmic adaptor subunit [Burkholderiaceae bacterium]
MAGKRLLTLAGVGVLIGGIGLALWLRPSDESEGRARPVGPRIDVAVPRPVAELPYVSQTGFLRASESTEVSSEIAARIARVSPSFVPGERVQMGHELIVLESTTLAADLARAQAQLERATAARDRSVAALRRERRLVERNFRSAASLDTARTEAETARADVAAARASVEAARKRHEGMTIAAPFDALVVEERASRGQFVQPGTPLGRLVLADHAELPLRVRPEVFERIGSFQALGTTVSIHDSRSDRKLAEGTITAIAPELDAKTRTRELLISVPDPFSREPPLTLNALAVARLPFAQGPGRLFALPDTALQADQSVWMVDEQGRLRPLQFELIARRDESILIRSEQLAAATRVMTTRIDVPVAGMPVRTAGEPERVASP